MPVEYNDELELQVADLIESQVKNGVLFNELGGVLESARMREELMYMSRFNPLKNSLESKIRTLDELIESIDDKDRIHGQVDSNGAVTGRMTHTNPNLASVPRDERIRKLFIVPDGYKMVGVDANSLELRMLAHYMNDEDYIEEIINGDIHEANRLALGVQSRDTAKHFIFAFLYGAGDEKLGKILGGKSAIAREHKEHFLYNTPALKDLRASVDRACSKGWLTGIDGRRLKVTEKHKGLNILLQSAGAIVMKRALVMLSETARGAEIDFKFVLNVHDEIQTEVREDQAELFGEMALVCIREAGAYYKLRCPMDAEYKIGENWSHTH